MKSLPRAGRWVMESEIIMELGAAGVPGETQWIPARCSSCKTRHVSGSTTNRPTHLLLMGFVGKLWADFVDWVSRTLRARKLEMAGEHREWQAGRQAGNLLHQKENR